MADPNTPPSTPAAPTVVSPTDGTAPAAPAADPALITSAPTGAGVTAAPSTAPAPQAATAATPPGSNSGNADGMIKFSSGLEGIVSASNLSGGADGAGGGGLVGSGGMGGEVLSGGWISDEKLKQVAVHLTVFQPSPLVSTADSKKYKLIADAGLAGGACGDLSCGERFGQPNTLVASNLQGNSTALNKGNFKVGAAFPLTVAIKSTGAVHGIEYFKHYYPDLGIDASILGKWVRNLILNIEIIIPTSASEGKAYRLKIVDQGPNHDAKDGSGLWVVDIMSPWALLSAHKDSFSVAVDGNDVNTSTEWKFPFADNNYNYVTGEIEGFGPDAEIAWGLDSHETSNIGGFGIKNKGGICRAKLFIDPSQKEKAEEIAGKTLPDELFTFNGTYGSGGVGSAAVSGVIGYGATGDGYLGISTAGITDEEALAIINKTIEYAPVSYPPLETPCFWNLYKGNSVFGRHGQGGQMVTISPPDGYPLFLYDSTKPTKMTVHRLIADRVLAAMKDILNHYGPNMYSIIPGACHFFGGYVDKSYGSYWSSHAYGVAMDFDANCNGLKWSMRNLRRARVRGNNYTCPTLAQAIYKPWWEIWYHHGFFSQGIESEITRKRPGNAHDWMHIQFAHWNCAR